MLCSQCEERLNSGGERWTLARACGPSAFPLRELIAALPANSGAAPGLRWVRADAGSGIDSGKLGYFALSLVWRYAAAGRLQLGEWAEPLRQFLLGARLTDEAAVVCSVLTDSLGTRSLAPPTWARPGPTPRGGNLAFQIPGIGFRVALGSAAGAARGLCLLRTNNLFLGSLPEKHFGDATRRLLAGVTPKAALARDLERTRA